MKQIKAIVGLSTTQCIQREVYGKFLISYDVSVFFLKELYLYPFSLCCVVPCF